MIKKKFLQNVCFLKKLMEPQKLKKNVFFHHTVASSITTLYLTNSLYNEWILENTVIPLHVNFSLYNELSI